MQNRISYHILSLLHLNGSVKIPGLGRFRQAYRKSEQDADAQRLIPPQTDTLFKAGESLSGSLLEKYVAYRTDQSRTKARKEILQFTQEIQSAVRNGESAHLGYLGQLSPGIEGLNFAAEEEFLNPGSSLPEISFVARAGFEIEEEVPASSQDEPVAVLPPLTFSTKEAEEIHTHISASAPAIPAEPEEPIVSAPVSVPEPAPNPVQTMRARSIAAPMPVTKKEREWLGPVIALCLLAIIACAFLLFTGGSERSKGTPDLVSDQAEGTSAIQEESPEEEATNAETRVVLADSGYKPDAVTTPPSEDREEESQTGGDTISPDQTDSEPAQAIPPASTGGKECLIVVGAFSMTQNADRMSRQLQELGYEVRSVQTGRLAQVGVPVTCEETRMQELQERLRGTVEPSAWVLRPE